MTTTNVTTTNVSATLTERESTIDDRLASDDLAPVTSDRPDQPTGLRTPTTEVFVVDDDSVQRLHVSKMLARLGYETVTASDGYEALDLLERFRPQFVLMDWRMPGIDGRETARRIRRRERATGDEPVRLIGMTGAARLSDRSLCLDAGMDAYLVKPFGIGMLSDVLTRWTSDSSAGDDPDDESDGDGRNIDRALDALVDSLGDRGFVLAIVQTFLDDLPSRLEAIVDGDHAGDRVSAARQLKRSSRSLGAEQLAALCAEVESNDDRPETIRHIATVAANSAQLLRSWSADAD